MSFKDKIILLCVQFTLLPKQMWPCSFSYLYSWSLAHSQKSCLGEHSGYNDLRCTIGTFISRVHISVSKHWNEFLIALLHESYHFPIWTGLCLTILTKKLQTVLVHLSQSLTLFQAIPSKFIRMILKSSTLQDCKIIYLIFAWQKKWIQKGIRNQRYTVLSN